jgi:ribosome-binding factor A
MSGFKRADRVSEAIKREVSLMLISGVKDPAIHFVTVTTVDTAEDLRNATIYVSVLGDEKTRQESLEGLQRAKGFIRKELGAKLNLRYNPDIHFKLDESLDHSIKIRTILNEIKDKDQEKKKDGE